MINLMKEFSEKDAAERILFLIKENGDYKAVSEKTGISVSTLFRIANNKTSPKLTDIIKIAENTNTTINYIAFGYSSEIDVHREAQNGLKRVLNLLSSLSDTFGIYEILKEKISKTIEDNENNPNLTKEQYEDYKKSNLAFLDFLKPKPLHTITLEPKREIDREQEKRNQEQKAAD